jgi:hypothetical protein
MRLLYAVCAVFVLILSIFIAFLTPLGWYWIGLEMYSKHVDKYLKEHETNRN